MNARGWRSKGDAVMMAKKMTDAAFTSGSEIPALLP